MKLNSSVKCGPKEELSINENKFDCLTDGFSFLIRDKKSGRCVGTTFANAVWWIEENMETHFQKAWDAATQAPKAKKLPPEVDDIPQAFLDDAPKTDNDSVVIRRRGRPARESYPSRFALNEE